MWGVAARAVVAASAVLWLSACGGITDPSDNRVESFPGTLVVGGSNQHDFSADKNGEFDIRLTALSNPNLFVGLALGQFSSGQCLPYPGYINELGQLNRAALLGPIQKGRWCVFVYDSGALTEPITYTVAVSRP